MASEILAVIKFFITDAKAEEKFYRHILKIDNIDPSYLKVMGAIDKLYQLFPEKKSCTPDELRVYFNVLWPASKDGNTFLNDIVQSAMDQKIGPEITTSLIEAVIERQMAAKIEQITAPIVSNQTSGTLPQVDNVMRLYSDLVVGLEKDTTLNPCEVPFDKAIKMQVVATGLKWPLRALDRCLGRVVPSLGMVCAPPDTGKTSFLLNMMAYFTTQLHKGEYLLYLNNEEAVIRLKARFGISLLGVKTEWAENNPRLFGQKVVLAGGNAVKFHGGVTQTRDALTLIKKYKPKVVVADQITKFHLPGNEPDGPQRIANVLEWFRSVANDENTMVIGAAQAGASAGQWVKYEDVYGSKTAAGGELDWFIGIGGIDDPGFEGIRFININKNKLKFGMKGRSEVLFFPDRCRYKDK